LSDAYAQLCNIHRTGFIRAEMRYCIVISSVGIYIPGSFWQLTRVSACSAALMHLYLK